MDRATYDESISWLREAVARARIGDSDRMHALKSLKSFSRGL